MSQGKHNSETKRRTVYVNALLLGSLLLLIAPKLYTVLSSPLPTATSAGNTRSWLQPDSLSQPFLQPISNNHWDFDFTKIESFLWRLKVSQTGQLRTDNTTLALLEEISALLPNTLSANDKPRIHFLIQKSLPSDLAGPFSELLEQYQAYTLSHESRLRLVNQAAGEQKLTLLLDMDSMLEHYQQRYFGEQANTLFADKNITTHYVNRRRIVRLNQNLSSTQKERQLNQLKDAYKASINIKSNR